MKRGQITLFIIIGIIFVLIVLLVIYYNIPQKNNNNDINSQIDNLKGTINECILESSKESLSIIGAQGGYFNKPENYYDMGLFILPYYYLEGKNLVPTNEKIQKELEDSINQKTSECLKTDSNEIQVKHNTIKSKVIIEKEKVNFFIDSEVTISKGNNIETIKFKDFPITIPSKLYDIMEIARYITDSQMKDPDYICATCIDSMCEEKNVYFDMVDFIENNTKQIILMENVTEPRGYFFEFLNKYKR